MIDHQDFIEKDWFHWIGEAADEAGFECYVIGGYVRDLILKRKEPKDIDIVAVGSGIDLAHLAAKRFPGKPKVSYFKNFGTAQIRYGDLDIEFVGARKESYQRNSRKPIVEDGSLEDDQNRRDFTINALAIGLNKGNWGKLIDPFDGMRDLEKGIIRTPLDPYITFSDDPLRMMRAIRFATQLDFSIHPQALRSIKDNADRLQIVSKERIMDEFNKIMEAPQPGKGLIKLFETGLLQQFFPELIALQGVEEVEGQLHKDNFYHTAEVVDNISRNTDNLWLRWAALLHDIGKPVTKRFIPKQGWTFHGHEFVGSKMIPRVFKRLRLPLNEKMKYVQKLVKMSSRPIAVTGEESTDSAVRRLLFDAGDDIDDLMILCEADITTKNENRKRRYLRNFQKVREKLVEVEEKDRVRNWQPPIDGQDIMDTFGIGPGKEVGIIKSAIKDAILDGVIPNEREAATQFMLEKASTLGLKKKD
ncbi:MAG: CCA tRNA nucleotidyltransferase [Bacteroidota bacterium]|nr:CCA tRNA nucleotidyltransferase [Bacteroidota bacterium]